MVPRCPTFKGNRNILSDFYGDEAHSHFKGASVCSVLLIIVYPGHVQMPKGYRGGNKTHWDYMKQKYGGHACLALGPQGGSTIISGVCVHRI